MLTPRWSDELGYSADELIGKISPGDLVYKEDRRSSAGLFAPSDN